MSSDLKARKPSDTLFEAAAVAMSMNRAGRDSARGSSLPRDVGPARNGGCAALFAGDRTSLSATTEQLKIRFARMRCSRTSGRFRNCSTTPPIPPPLILDPKTLDLSRVIADQEAIRRGERHRGHMSL